MYENKFTGLSVTPTTRFHGEHANKVITQHGYLAGLIWAQTNTWIFFPVTACLRVYFGFMYAMSSILLSRPIMSTVSAKQYTELGYDEYKEK